MSGLIGNHGAETLPLFIAAGQSVYRSEPDAELPPMPPGEEVIHDYRSLTLSLKAHPVSFVRERLASQGVVAAGDLHLIQPGRIVTIAGRVVVRQRPGTASGVIFASLEDETGLANIIVWPRTFETYRKAVLTARMLAVKGEVQREGLVVHLIDRELVDLTPLLLRLGHGQDIGDGMVANADERHGPKGSARGVSRVEELEAERRSIRDALPSGRNFH